MNTEDKQPKEEFRYFNDEWNNDLMNTPIEVLETINQDRRSIETFYPKYNKIKIIKNNKPDGRRYKK